MILLKTRCGCVRTLKGTYQQYGREIKVPLMSDAFHYPMDAVSAAEFVQVRCFDYQDRQGDYDVYLERMEGINR